MKEGVARVMDEPVLDDRPARSWLDAFPWIQAASREIGSDESGDLWWQKPIDSSDSDQRRRRLAQISGWALERLTRWTIGQIFPGLPADTVLADLPLTTRAQNALARFGYQVAADLQNEELVELLGWPQVGIGTVDSILQGLANAATTSAAPAVLRARQEGIGRRRHAFQAGDDLVSWGDSFVEDLRQLASWYVAVGTPARMLLGEPIAKGTPAEVVKARQRLEMITAGDVLDQTHIELDAAELLQRSISALDDRAQQILARRFFADQPETLDQLGGDMGVTRERVRQIEARARAAMVEFLAPGGALELVGCAARDLIGTVRPLDDVLALLPALSKQVEAVGQPAWRVLDCLDDAYEIQDGWCAAPTMLGAQTVMQARLQELADQHGVVRLEDVDLIDDDESGTDTTQVTCDWLSYCGYIVHGEFVFTRTQSVGDRAASILSITGSPMSSQEILNQFGVERSIGSLRNAMGVDDRFERVDRDRWALAEWGLDTYAGVRALVREQVARHGGRVSLDALVEVITGKYSVTASSVVAYASSPPFEARGGVVRLAGADREIRKSPERTRRLYRRGGSWIYRVRITKDHLRGSGSVAPIAIAGVLDLQYGQTRLLDSEFGQQSINWTGAQPAFGTIRRFLIADDVTIDSEVFLVVGDDGTFGVELVPPSIGDPVADAIALVGVASGPARADARAVLTTAIGLPAESPVASIIGAYRERGDSDVADLLIAAKDELEGVTAPDRPVASAEIDEILDLL